MKVMKNTTKIIQRVTTDMTDIFYNFTKKIDDYTRFSSENNDETIISTTKSVTTTTTTTRPTTATTTIIENTTSRVTASPSTTLPTARTTTTSIPLELFKLITTDEPENITTNKTLCTKLPTTTTTTPTEEPFDEFGPPEGLEYIFVPLGVMIFVIILSGVVLIISRRRKLEILKNRLMPLYNLEPGESGEDDWETELLDESLSGGRQRRQGYQSMDNEESAELFTQ